MSNITQKWVELLNPFSKEYNKKMTASEISRETKIPQQTATRILNSLVKKNLIEYQRQGKNKLFYLNLKTSSTEIILNLVENQKALDFLIENKKEAVIIEDLLKHCESIILFGSYASKKFDEKSDLDLVIIGKSDKKKIKEIKERQILEINEHYTDFVEFENKIKERNALSIEIIKNHIVLGDVSTIIKIFLRGEYGRK